MKKLSFLAITAIVMMGVAFASCDSTKSVSIKTEMDSISYIIGASWGQGFKERSAQLPGASTNPLNMEAAIKGFIDAANGDSIFLGMDMNAAGTFANNYFQSIMTKEAEASSEESNKFLAENAKQSGVITTESGLQYKVITEGTGPKPTIDDVVKVHYHGTLLNGDMFDSSIQNGEPVEFPIARVIEGWKEGVQLMPVGSKYMFWIPAELAYGPAGSGHQYSGKLLIFEVELFEIVKK